ncbi:hypothetical protein D9M72_600760 [compost metagenome]
MNGEADILEDRVQVLAFTRRRDQPRKRIGRQQNEERKGHRDPGLDRKHIRLQRFRQVAPEGCDQCREERQDQQPQQHRSLVVPPHTRDLVDQRLQGMGVFPDVANREVRGHIGEGEHNESESDQQKTGDRCA